VNDGVLRWLQRIAQLAAEAEGRLQRGASLTKYCSGVIGVKKHARSVFLNEAGDALCWGPEGGDRSDGKKVKALPIETFLSVEKGAAGVAAVKGVDEVSPAPLPRRARRR
jgi:hypothetical protein